MTRSHAIRTILIAAVVVLSMVGGPIVFSTPSAAAGSVTINDFSPSTVDENTRVTHTLDLTIGNFQGSTGNLTVTLPPGSEVRSASVDSISGATVTDVVIDGNELVVNLSTSASGDVDLVLSPTVQHDDVGGSDESGSVDVEVKDAGGKTQMTSTTLTVAAAGTDEPLEDAPSGTIFATLVKDDGSTVKSGFIKRGDSGGQIYNPWSMSIKELESAEASESDETGDVLVARDGTRYVVNVDQQLQGSSGFVGPGATVFQGESETRFVGFDVTELVGVENQGAEGLTLDLNQTIPASQEPGVYAPNGNASLGTITVNEPQISRVEVINENGDRLGSGATVQEDEFMIYRANFNFMAAENGEFGPLLRDGSPLVQGIVSLETAVGRSTNDPKVIQNLNSNFNDSEAKRLANIPVSEPFRGHTDTLLNTIPKGKATRGDPFVLDKGLQNPNVAPQDTEYFIFDLNAVEKPGPVTAMALSENDEPQGDIFDSKGLTKTMDLTIEAAEDTKLEFPNHPDAAASQGDFVEFDVRGSSVGAGHIVSVDASDLRRDASERSGLRLSADDGEQIRSRFDVFRAFDDSGFTIGIVDSNGNFVQTDGTSGTVRADGTIDTSVNPTIRGDEIVQVYTPVNIDSGGIGKGQIDTQFLDDSTVDVNLYREGGLGAYLPNLQRPVDERSLRLSEADRDFSIDRPGDTYFAGEEIDVRGTASPAVDDVLLYARDEDEFEAVDLDEDGSITDRDAIAVTEGGNWSEANVDLAEANDILNFPGQYDIGVIGAEAADKDDDGQPDRRINSTAFSAQTSYQRPIRVVNQTLEATIRTYRGQVAEEDRAVNVSGQANGADVIGAIFIGEDGNLALRTIRVNEDMSFDNDNLNIPNRIRQGRVQLVLVSPSRDGVFGDGLDGGEVNVSGSTPIIRLGNFVQGIDGSGLTGEQARDRLAEFVWLQEGSDDLIAAKRFRLTDASTQITAVAPASRASQSGVNPVVRGSEMIVRGNTNLKPDDNTIRIEVRTGQEGERVGLNPGVVDQWGQDGNWSVRVAVPSDIQTGTYVVEADDGVNVNSREFQVVSQLPSTPRAETPEPEPEPTATPTETPRATATPTPERTPAPTPEPEPTATPTPTPTQGGGPGFGISVAVIALLAAAAVAGLRRRRR